MSVRDLCEQFTIQGAYCIKRWSEEDNDCVILAEGKDFECEHHKLSEECVTSRVEFMYAIDGVLHIELESVE